LNISYYFFDSVYFSSLQNTELALFTYARVLYQKLCVNDKKEALNMKL